ncbi:hypothetical protein Pcinc_023959 [Petrolisthes cinctipes]|uniref:Uncharacterized protein n=1 Tax=Petrolisthes cinctipes TaxID=88211 RepID=A0AAE1KEA6_PETCI|nr:hypothetical protein Pcinc_023959 [Petrolisthes cinctipes]
MNRHHHDSTARRARMVGMCKAGLNVSGAARMMGVSRSTVRCWRDRWVTTGSLRDLPRSGLVVILIQMTVPVLGFDEVRESAVLNELIQTSEISVEQIISKELEEEDKDMNDREEASPSPAASLTVQQLSKALGCFTQILEIFEREAESDGRQQLFVDTVDIENEFEGFEADDVMLGATRASGAEAAGGSGVETTGGPQSNNSVEEYILACRKRFAEDDVLHERVIFYQQTKQHVDGITNAERKRIWRRSSSFEWNEADKTLYFIQAAASRRKSVPEVYKEPLELLGVDLIGGANLGGYCQTRDVSFVHRLMMNFARPMASRVSHQRIIRRRTDWRKGPTGH